MNKRSWKFRIGVAAGLVAVGTVVAVFAAHRKVVPPDPAVDRDKAVAFVASEEFSRMPLAQQREYAAKLRPPRGQRPPQQQNGAGEPPPRPDEKLTEEQRKLFHQNMRQIREAEMNERLDKFFAMSKEEQLAELDKRIAEHQARRKEHGQRPPEPPQQSKEQTAAAKTGKTTDAAQTGKTNTTAQNSRRRRPPTAQERRDHDEEMSPATRAKMHAYFQMMRLREQGKLK